MFYRIYLLLSIYYIYEQQQQKINLEQNLKF
jgi:hypothetical protein